VKLPSVGLWLNASKSESILESDDAYLFLCEDDIPIEAEQLALRIIAEGLDRLEGFRILGLFFQLLDYNFKYWKR
jgi:hypothetical protein